MKVNKKVLINIYLVLILASTMLLISNAVFVKRLNNVFYDNFFRLEEKLTSKVVSKDIIMINMVEADHQQYSFPELIVKQREGFIKLLKSLKHFGVKIVYFDTLIVGPSTSRVVDLELINTIKKSENVILPYVAVPRLGGALQRARGNTPFIKNAKNSGFVSIMPDKDGVFRRIDLVLNQLPGELSYNVVLKIMMEYFNYDKVQLESEQIILSKGHDQIKIPFFSAYKMLLNWKGDVSKNFKAYSSEDIFDAYEQSFESKITKIDEKLLANSICIVSVPKTDQLIKMKTPTGSSISNSEIIARAVTAMINKDFIRVVSNKYQIFILYFLALISVGFVFINKRFREILALIFVVLIVLAAYILFLNNIHIDIALFLITFIGCCFLTVVYRFVYLSLEVSDLMNVVTVDEHTGLCTIRYFRGLLDKECKINRNDLGSKFCLLICDIDDFKQINDQYGHQAGDFVLKEVADILKSSVRNIDIVARYGGDEMMILLKGVLLKDGEVVAEKIRKAIEDSGISDEVNKYSVTLSIGVACFNELMDTEATLIKRADDALYKAKNAGRNKVVSLDA